MRDVTMTWAAERDMPMFSQAGYNSPTVSTITNSRGFDVDAMAKFMSGRGFSIDKGYGKIKGKTIRIAHMGDLQMNTLEDVLSGLDDFLASLN
jgi:aspartate aminotransferase-like enzyme